MWKFNRPAQSFSFQSHFVTDQKLMTLLHRWSLACLNVKTSLKVGWLLDTSLSWPFLIFWSNNFLPVVCKSFPCNDAEIHHFFPRHRWTRLVRVFPSLNECSLVPVFVILGSILILSWRSIRKTGSIAITWYLVFGIDCVSRDCSLVPHPKSTSLLGYKAPRNKGQLFQYNLKTENKSFHSNSQSNAIEKEISGGLR